VLRFDYYGCGDSSGRFEQARISDWRSDVGAAIKEMQRQTGLKSVCLVGLRVGASLAMLAGAEHPGVDSMVLWDPVVRGRDYCSELDAAHQRMLHYAHVLPEREGTGETTGELLGFPLTTAQRSDLETLDLMSCRSNPAVKMLLIKSNPKTELGQLETHIRSMEVAPAVQRFPNPGLWVWDEAVGRVLVPNRILQSVVSWLIQVCP
jgi:pimeloyl-ACP methyl ester carboxylesterase